MIAESRPGSPRRHCGEGILRSSPLIRELSSRGLRPATPVNGERLSPSSSMLGLCTHLFRRWASRHSKAVRYCHRARQVDTTVRLDLLRSNILSTIVSGHMRPPRHVAAPLVLVLLAGAMGHARGRMRENGQRAFKLCWPSRCETTSNWLTPRSPSHLDLFSTPSSTVSRTLRCSFLPKLEAEMWGRFAPSSDRVTHIVRQPSPRVRSGGYEA